MDNSLRYAIARVEIQVQDVNDNVPQFDYDMYNITVMENLPTGFTVVQVMKHMDTMHLQRHRCYREIPLYKTIIKTESQN